MSATLSLQSVETALIDAGLTPRGAFRPDADDGVPDLGPGRPARTLVLAGGAGPAMWSAFVTARDPVNDLLDDWSSDVLGGLAAEFGAIAHFPSNKPYLP